MSEAMFADLHRLPSRGRGEGAYGGHGTTPGQDWADKDFRDTFNETTPGEPPEDRPDDVYEWTQNEVCDWAHETLSEDCAGMLIAGVQDFELDGTGFAGINHDSLKSMGFRKNFVINMILDSIRNMVVAAPSGQAWDSSGRSTLQVRGDTSRQSTLGNDAMQSRQVTMEDGTMRRMDTPEVKLDRSRTDYSVDEMAGETRPTRVRFSPSALKHKDGRDDRLDAEEQEASTLGDIYRNPQPFEKKSTERFNTGGGVLTNPYLDPKMTKNIEQYLLNKGEVERPLITEHLHVPVAKQYFSYDINAYMSHLTAVRGRAWPWKPWLAIMIWTFMVCIVHKRSLGLTRFDRSVNKDVQNTFGMVLGFLLVFQSQQSIDRWTEGRGAWENIIFSAREAYRILISHCDASRLVKKFGLHLIAFAVLAKALLRDEKKADVRKMLEDILSKLDVARLMNAQNAHLRCCYSLYVCERVLEACMENELTYRALERDIRPGLSRLHEELSTCERVLYTPLPWIYTVHLRFMMAVYLLTLPLMFFDLDCPEDPNFKCYIPSWYGIMFYTGLISYAFLGLEDMAIEIQNPFGDDYSDLPLDTFVTIIFNSIRLMTPRCGPGACYNKDFEDQLHKDAEMRSEMRLYKDKDELKRFRKKLKDKKRALRRSNKVKRQSMLAAQGQSLGDMTRQNTLIRSNTGLSLLTDDESSSDKDDGGDD